MLGTLAEIRKRRQQSELVLADNTVGDYDAAQTQATHSLDLQVSYVAIDDLEECWVAVITTGVELRRNFNTVTTRLETFETKLSFRIRR